MKVHVGDHIRVVRCSVGWHCLSSPTSCPRYGDTGVVTRFTDVGTFLYRMDDGAVYEADPEEVFVLPQLDR